MVTVTADAFAGFEPAAIQFLADLAANNDRAWFQPRKSDYERLLKRPLEALCVALDERFRARGIPLVADPARSPFRIYRDTRFARDKSPYKRNVGASFPWQSGGDEPRVHGAGGYFHLEPGEIFVGGGMWHPEKERLDAWRRSVDSDPKRIREIIDEPSFVATYGGVSRDDDYRLKRVPAGYPPDHPEADLLKLKDIVFGRRLSDHDATSPDLPDVLADSLSVAVPLMRLLSGL
ncbi:MAG TPA: DUF2461 domain-containing protein [Candidatus Limnocylindrales bacterium]|nr:DUF2461 domain-containing protein [Candidatus Limnocylindrales bacterium]